MNRRMFSIAAFVLFAAAFAGAAAASHFDHVPAKDHERVNPVAHNPHAIEAGRQIYMDHCAECHQADARGDGKKKPSLITPEVHNATDGDLEWFLRQGDLRHGMPSWSSLPQAQRWDIVAYLRSLQ